MSQPGFGPSSASRSGSLRARLASAGASLAALALCAAGAGASPVAHFRLDEGSGVRAADASGRTGAARLVAGPRWTRGIAGSALAFRANGQRALVPHGPALDLRRQLTLAAWVRPAARGSQTILAKALHGEVDGYALQLSSKGTVFVRFNQATRDNDYRVSSKAAYPTDGQTWLHVAATYDGAEIRLYLDGARERSRSTARLFVARNAQDLAIGAHPDGSLPFDGAIDDVRVYDRALSAAEIRALVKDGRPTDRDGDYVPDAEDAFPDDPSEWADHDGDGRGDDADLDDDGDGLPDGWEIANGLDPRDPRDAARDADRDGVSNLEELRRGSNPRDDAAGGSVFSRLSRGRPAPLGRWAAQAVMPRPSRGGTGEKPQSKVWSHDGRWWAVFADRSGTWIWRRDGDQWSRVLPLFRAVAAKADYALDADGALVHLLLHSDTAGTSLLSAEYVPGFPGTYRAWRQRSAPVALPLEAAAETATIALDTRRRLWVAYDSADSVRVRHATPADGYRRWSAPSVLGRGIDAADDIAAIAAFGGKVGVMWSNGRSGQFVFRHREDRDPPTLWAEEEWPGAEAARTYGRGLADDHINFAVGGDGTLYAAIKTAYDAPGHPMIGLLVRRPSGRWEPLRAVDGHGSRPIALLNERARQLMVAYTSDAEGGRIVYRVADLASLEFGKRITLIDGTDLNNVSSTKQSFDGELVVIASTQDEEPKVLGVSLGASLPAAPAP